MNILNNNGIYLHVSHFVSLLLGITLEWNEASRVQRSDRQENVLDQMIAVKMGKGVRFCMYFETRANRIC